MSKVRGELGGQENAKRLRAYIDALRADRRGVPARGSGPNLSAIAKACGFDRGVFYSNQEVKLLLNDAWEQLGLDDGMPDPTTAYEVARLKDEAKSPGNGRVDSLEKEVLLLRSENAQLKAEAAKYKALQQLMISTGRMP